MAQTDYIVFYSWQSDLPSRTNRNFILDALKNAAKALGKDEARPASLIIDRDTQNVPGSPEIATTILGKIDRAQIFVCDLSIINQGAARTTPNPNVLIELGYALKALGKDRIIMLLNKAYGDEKLLPFDLHTYRIAIYHMTEGGDRAAARRDLENVLKAALSSIVETLALSHPKEEVVSPVEQARRSIETSRLDQKARVRDYMADVTKRISLLTPKDTSSMLDEQLLQAIEGSTEVVLEFSQLAQIIVEMHADDAAQAMYKGFGKILDLYTLPPAGPFTNGSIVYDIAKFLGHELFVIFMSLFMWLDRWETIASLLGEELYARKENYRHPSLIPFYSLSTPVPLLFKRSERLLRESGRQTIDRSLHARLLRDRHQEGELAGNVPFEQFMEADLFLFFHGQFHRAEKQEWPAWLPWSTVYLQDGRIPRFFLEAEHFGYARELMRSLGVTDLATLRTRFQECCFELDEIWSRGFYTPWSNPLHRYDFNRIGSK